MNSPSAFKSPNERPQPLKILHLCVLTFESKIIDVPLYTRLYTLLFIPFIYTLLFGVPFVRNSTGRFVASLLQLYNEHARSLLRSGIPAYRAS